MQRTLTLLISLHLLCWQISAQQNWAAVPCFQLKNTDGVGRLFVDSAHNELILVPSLSYQICNTTYKGLFAYNVHTFHDLDIGINTHNPNPYSGNVDIIDCVEYNNKTIVTGVFFSVGSKTLYAKSIAVWDGTQWSTFSHPFWNNTPSWTTGGGFTRLLKDNGKLWMFAGFDSTGNNFTSKIVQYDGSTFTTIPSIPVSHPAAISETIMYKGKVVVAGNFDNYPSTNYDLLAQFDGTSWSPVGGGVHGNLSACQTVAVYKDTLYIAGSFSKSDGNAGNYVMKWDGSQMHDAGFNDTFCGYGAVWKLLVYRDRLYAFGAFNCAANQTAYGVAYYENGVWTVPPDVFQNVAITDAAVYNDAIYIGGQFKGINGDTTLKKFVKLVCPDFDAARGCLSGLNESSRKLSIKVFPNPSNDKIQLEFDQGSPIDKITVLNTLGQEVFRLLKPISMQEIDVSGFPVGIYLMKAESKQGQTVFKLVKE